MKKILKAWKEYRSLFVFIALMLVFRSAFADWNTVPTGSMKPTILEGDRILVNKMAYDLRLPFTHLSLYKIADPARGDIVVFDSEVSGKKLIKRIIGVPGDIVALQNNALTINGNKLSYSNLQSSPLTTDKIENLFGLTHTIRVQKEGSQLSDFGSVKVPDGHYLVLGDNRDSSADSRVIGFVPRGEIVGRSQSVILSLDYDNFYMPRSDRFLQRL